MTICGPDTRFKLIVKDGLFELTNIIFINDITYSQLNRFNETNRTKRMKSIAERINRIDSSIMDVMLVLAIILLIMAQKRDIRLTSNELVNRLINN